jgi:hypothetical protein
MSEHPREVRARLDENNRRLAEARASKDRQTKAASDRLKAKQDDERRARAHQIVKQNLNRPF